MMASATGPFYCPQDSRVYLDLGFFQDLSDRFGAPGDFARAYVIAHEVGHHVPQLMGIAGRAQAGSVPMELQADCFADVAAANRAPATHSLPRTDLVSAVWHRD
jgi:hypothetical protein